ncbi:hypothetical protein [Aneurinibacillus tyrosinisolvens]|uniref:hypothetical protein n=1 Tax=Aneurinibacillus tyrosinisolvens TaxID=1443435 RepID=UPI00063FA289|nr:hypothetical protein [Aneurinibacillus tyrosinisolvens]
MNLNSFAYDDMTENPNMALLALQCRKKFKDGEIPETLFSNFVQRHMGEIRLEDYYFFMKFYADFFTGNILETFFSVRESPHKDNCVAENNEVLSRLPSIFQAKFLPCTGGGADNDGYLGWEKPIIMRRFIAEEGCMYQIYEYVKPKRVSLEVGSTEGGTTFRHIYGEVGVARWAYHSDRVYIYTHKNTTATIPVSIDDPLLNLNGFPKVPDIKHIFKEGVFIWDKKSKQFVLEKAES